MKNTILILTMFLAAMPPLAAQEHKGVTYVQCNRLGEEGDSLVFDMDICVDMSAVAGYEAIRLTPELSDGGNSLEMPYVEIQGKHRGRMGDRWEALRSKKYGYEEPYAVVRIENPRHIQTDTLVSYRMRFPYELWMDGAELVVHQEIIGLHGEFRLLTINPGNRVELEPRQPFEPQFEVAFIEPAPEVKRRKKQGQAFLDFPVGQSAILPNYRRNPEELAKIHDAFADISGNSDVQVQGLYVEGYASPEGRYDINERLARERSNALKYYMMEQFGMPAYLFRVNYTAEDWKGLRMLVEGSGADCESQALGIIDSAGDPDVREAELKKLCAGTLWRAMLRDMFPLLRRVEYQIDYLVRDFTEEEIVKMIGVSDDMLSHRELYLGAWSFGKGSPSFEKVIIDLAPRFFPDDPAATNNAVAVLIGKGELITAKRYLERLGDNPAAQNNLGIVHLLFGELDKAQACFEASAAAGVRQAAFNLEQVRLKREDNIRMERYKNR